ncbi:MAG: hypothetical protein FJ290_13480 [Planctomycetes bacterium]|nr:hypothetical protein [Planctomycetota bacterium]
MTCKDVAEQLDAYELGCLEAARREGIEAHLASCAACRERLAEVRRADAAVRAALAWAEPATAFATRMAGRARRRIVLRRGAAGAVAAAALVGLGIALLSGSRGPAADRVAAPPQKRPAEQAPASSGSLLAGEVYDAYGESARRLVPGRSYAAAEPVAMSVGANSLLVMGRGSQFASGASQGPGGPRVSLLAGSLVGQVGSRGKELAIELAPDLGGAIARTKGCEFYSAGFPANRLAAGVAFPAGSLAHWPEDIRVHVFTGHLEIDLGTQKLSLGAGDSAIISGGVSAGTARTLGERVRALHEALGERLLAEWQLYASLCDGYARRLLQLRAMAERDGLPHLAERVALVEGLLRDHTAALRRLEGQHPQLIELEAAEAELRRLEFLHDEADHALERVLLLLDGAG